MTKDLQGLLVVALEQAVAAPYATSRLADAGARVIKIERAEGDFARGYDRYVNGESAYFVWLNRGKESLVLNVKHAEDLALLKRMIAKADIFVQNLAPGATARLSIGSDELRARHPRLITCDISGYGEDGPYAEMKAYDLLVQAESGLCGVTGSDSQPARVGVSVCDIAAGMYSHQAILQALIGRGVTGQGRGIKVSLFDAMADWMNVPYLQFAYSGHTPPLAGLNHPTIAPYGAYPCGDGAAVLISIQNGREWQRLCTDVLERPDLVEDPRFADNPARVANRPALNAIIAEVFGRAHRETVSDKLAQAGIAFGRLNSVDDFRHHPQTRFACVETPAGPVDLVAPPPIVTGDADDLGPVPALGQHSDAIRAEFAP